MSPPRRIELEKDEDVGGWVAYDVDTGVASEGETREGALENLDEAVELYERDSEYDPEEEREFMKEIGLDPERQEELREERAGDLPEFME